MEYAIGVGGNRGSVDATIAAAAQRIQADGRVRLRASAALLTTAPVGGPPGQAAFRNGAWIVETELGPHGLLARLQRIEAHFGRVRGIANGPRTLDLDLLLARDGRQCESAVLQLPHPRLHERVFVLAPLVTVAPDWQVPRLGRTVAELYACLSRAHPPEVMPGHP